MTRTSIGTFGLLLAALVALAPCRAEAQLGGLKKKLKATVKGNDQSAAAKKADPGGPRFGGDLIEITEPVLDGFIRGVRTEVALQKEFRDLLAKYPTQEQYQACKLQAAQSDEAQKLAMAVLNLPENTSAAEFQRITTKAATDLEAIQKKRCPLDPNEWDGSKRTKRLEEIQLKAVEAAGSISPSDASAPLAAGPLSVGAYALLKERIVAFCMSKLDPKADFSVTPVQVPGSGTNIYFVYTSAEAKLLQAKCSMLMGVMSALMPV